MAYVFPTPADAPKKIFSLPRCFFSSSRWILSSSSSGSGRSISACGLHFVKRQVQLQHVHACLAKNTELTAASRTLNQCVDIVVRQLACLGNTIDLIRGGCRADLGIEATT